MTRESGSAPCDQETLDRAAEGDRKAIGRLATWAYPLMHKAVRGVMKSHDELEDAVQNALRSIVENPTTLAGLTPETAADMIWKTARNHACNVVRTTARREGRVTTEARLRTTGPDGHETSPMQHVAAGFARDPVYEAEMKQVIDALSPETSALLKRRFLDGETQQAIADELGLDRKKVERLYIHIRLQLLDECLRLGIRLKEEGLDDKYGYMAPGPAGPEESRRAREAREAQRKLPRPRASWATPTPPPFPERPTGRTVEHRPTVRDERVRERNVSVVEWLRKRLTGWWSG